MKTITMPYDEYIKELDEYRKELECLRYKKHLMISRLKPILDYTVEKDGSYVMLDDYSIITDKNEILVYIGKTIEDTLGWD